MKLSNCAALRPSVLFENFLFLLSTCQSQCQVMAGDKVPSIHALEKPEDLKALLRQDRGDDCLSCKIVGSGAFFGLAAYSYFSGMSQLERQRQAILQSKSVFGLRSRRFGIAGISLGLAWMGLWRASR
ncbi:hypothetical protein E4U41_006259 [Claviceps citrina]|nr:hypothetical protein E4U41_006259 [Claviceps citrina]